MTHKLQVHQFPCRSDNFGLLVHAPASGHTASIDTPDGEAIATELTKNNWQLTHIFNTHHHFDHIPGNQMLKESTGCEVIGARKDAQRIPLIDTMLEDGDSFNFGTHEIKMIETPGHTIGSVCYFAPEEPVLFTGDTLFSMGCGRLFEGSAELMWSSLQKLLALPNETQIYCGHEYTLTNAEFALEIEPDNKALQERAEQVRTLRRTGRATLPVTLATEKATNPFLRPDSSQIQHHFGLEKRPLHEVFAAIREKRNSF